MYEAVRIVQYNKVRDTRTSRIEYHPPHRTTAAEEGAERSVVGRPVLSFEGVIETGARPIEAAVLPIDHGLDHGIDHGIGGRERVM